MSPQIRRGPVSGREPGSPMWTVACSTEMPSGRASTGLQRERPHPGVVVGEPADPQQQVDQRRAVDRRGAAVAVQQRRRPGLVDQRGRRPVGERRAAPGTVAEQLAWRRRRARTRPPGRTPGPRPPRRRRRHPAGTIGCTSASGPNAAARSAYARRTAGSSRRSSRTAPRSIRCRTAVRAAFSATGRPSRSAAATAASSVVAGCDGHEVDAVRGEQRGAVAGVDSGPGGVEVDVRRLGQHARRLAAPVGVGGDPARAPGRPPRPTGSRHPGRQHAEQRRGDHRPVAGQRHAGQRGGEVGVLVVPLAGQRRRQRDDERVHPCVDGAVGQGVGERRSRPRPGPTSRG